MKFTSCLIVAACAVPAVASPRLIFHLDFNTIQMTRPAVERILEHVASVGYDAILWEIEDKVRWESCPEVVSPDAFTKDEFRGILARAKALGLEPIPLMQTFGHAEYVLGCEAYRHLREDPSRKNCYCPLNPGTLAFQRRLLAEYLDLFGPEVRRVHLGGDEAHGFGTCPKCRQRDRMDLYLSHLLAVSEDLRKRGIRPGIWQDMIHRFDPALSALGRLPKDFTIWFWEYAVEPHSRWQCWGRTEEEAAKRAVRDGREIFFCPSVQCVKEDPFTSRFGARLPNVYEAGEICHRAGLSGVCVTSWSVHQGLKEMQFPLIDYAAKRVRDPARSGAVDWWDVANRAFGKVSLTHMQDLTAWNSALGDADGRMQDYKDGAIPSADLFNGITNAAKRARLARLARDGARTTERALEEIRLVPEADWTPVVRLGVEAGELKVAYLTALARKLSGEPVGDVPFERTVRYYAREQSPYSAEHSARRIWTPVAENRAADDYKRHAAICLADSDPGKVRIGGAKDVVPLGEPGTPQAERGFANHPVFRKPPKRETAFTFASGGTIGVIEAAKGTEGLANELAWHIGEMCGTVPKVVARAPDGVPVLSLGIMGVRGDRSTRISTGGLRLLIEGGSVSGVSHGVTYLLEALGCRYLWPGRSGKVIPKRKTVEIPRIDFAFTPVLRIRGMRDCCVTRADGTVPKDRAEALGKMGIDADAYVKAYAAARLDEPGNRDFYAWHGVNEPQETDGEWGWGHYFFDYYKTYGKEHPDWFALQPNGSRELELGPMQERPVFCLSNAALAQETARRRIADFGVLKNYNALSICLPDGGWMGECLCENCRRLDPPNAPAATLNYPRARVSYPYVSLSDRLMTFNNRVAEAVTAALPGKRLTMYIYSCYDEPPVRVRPHPSLVFLSAAGDYADANRYGWARRNMEGWSRFGNPLLWRPNAHMGFRQPVPQNYARRIFGDFETFKVNNLVGTDFDCIAGQWAASGLNYYVIAKGHLNPDRLGYDDILDDCCRAGFGAAAEKVKAYFTALEAFTERAAATGKDYDGYVGLYDGTEFERLLDAAAEAVKDDPGPRARVRFLRRALEFARADQRLVAEWNAAPDDAAKHRAAQETYYRFVRQQCREDPIATVPSSLGYWYSKYLRR